MLKFWRFMSGFVTLELSGDGAESLLNAAAKNNINIWGLHCRKGKIIGNISIKNFIRLRYIKRGIKCRVKILKKVGVVFFTDKYKKRTGFLAGLAAFFIVIYLLTQHIWIINVVGNYNIPEQKILNACEKIGVATGIKRNKIKPQNDAQKLLLNLDGLAWASFNIEGCVLTVDLTEIKVPDEEDKESISNIKSSQDGKISKIDVTTGNVVVKVGDYVSKGDILVSGIIQQFGSTLFVHSRGVITATTERTFTEKADFIQKTDVNIDKARRYGIKFFNIEIPLYLGSVSGRHTSIKKINNLKLLNKKIPISIAAEEFTIMKQETISYKKEELEKILEKKIYKKVEEHNFISFKETDRSLIETDTGLSLEIKYDCEENIAVQDEILLGAQN